MGALTSARIGELIEPYFPAPGALLLSQLSSYLDLLLKWNSRTNLTAIRDPEAIVTRHFGESLFVAAHLPLCETLLDLGSGAGFPGLPILLSRPSLRVTLAESQNKKAAFLREVLRTLEVTAEVWADRAERMPAERRFDVVTLRAVDDPESALVAAGARVADGGWIAHLTSAQVSGSSAIALPGRVRSQLHLFRPE